jgi:hypothetical protein
MNNSGKLLKIVFVILLIIAVAELYYLFLYQPSIPNKKTISPTAEINKNQTTLSQEQISDLAVNRNQIKYLDTLKKINVEPLGLSFYTEGEGNVTNLRQIDDVRVSFDLVYKNGQIATDVHFPVTKDVPYTVYESKNDIMTPAELKSLKNGDLIKFNWQYDLKKDPSEDLYLNELVIYRK